MRVTNLGQHSHMVSYSGEIVGVLNTLSRGCLAAINDWALSWSSGKSCSVSVNSEQKKTFELRM